MVFSLLRDLDVQNEQRDESEIGNRSRTEVNPPVSSLSRRRVQFNDPQPRDNMEVEDDDIQESPALLSVFLSLKPILPAPDAEEKSVRLSILQFLFWSYSYHECNSGKREAILFFVRILSMQFCTLVMSSENMSNVTLIHM